MEARRIVEVHLTSDDLLLLLEPQHLGAIELTKEVAQRVLGVLAVYVGHELAVCHVAADSVPKELLPGANLQIGVKDHGAVEVEERSLERHRRLPWIDVLARVYPPFTVLHPRDGRCT